MSFLKVFFASVLGFFTSLFLIGLLAFAVVAGIIASLDDDRAPAVAANSVLEIDLAKSFGEFSATESIEELTGTHGVSLRELSHAVEAAADDSRIIGIRLKASGSPESWAAAEEIRRSIEAFRESGKFVVATVSERGIAEAGYFIASAADQIVIVPGASVELNGIAAVLPFFKPALDRLGIQAQVVRAGSFKSAVEPFILDSASAETRLMTRELVDGTFEQFRGVVASARDIPPATLRTLLSTRGLLSSGEAASAGLVDAVLYEDQIDSLLRTRTGDDDDDSPNMIPLTEYARTVSSGSTGDDQIAVVYAVGEIRAGKSGASANPLGGGSLLGSETFAEAMRTARESKYVKAVVVRIDSPGGEAAPSESMWREIVLTAAKKPVIASMGAVAASGGYYLAAACDTIVAESTTVTGSIGVFGLWFTAREFMRETMGVNLQIVRSDSLADMMSLHRQPTDLERAILQRSVDTTYQKFLRAVSQGRGITMAEADSAGQGRVYTGARAKQLKLVDEIGGLGRAIEIAAASAGLKSDAYGLRILPQRKSFIESMVETITQSSIASLFASPVDMGEIVREEIERRSGVQMLGPTVRIAAE